jgi:predicted dienelactone hydrolase
MSGVLTRDLARVRIYSTANAALPPNKKPYPVLILRAGASALVTGYTALAEDLASRGYVVVGPDAPYRTTVVVLPDGRSVRRLAQNDVEEQPEGQKVALATRLAGVWSTDIGFVLDKLAALNDANPSGRFGGRLDLEHIGVFGHSLGGATAAYFCQVDARCKAGVDLDGRLFGPVIETGLKQPFMFILEGHGPAQGETGKILAQFDSMYAHLPADSRLKVSITGSNHFSFTDQILLKSQVLLGLMRTIHALGGLDGRRGLTITSDYLCTFFDVYLKGYPRSALDALRMKYPEAVVD